MIFFSLGLGLTTQKHIKRPQCRPKMEPNLANLTSFSWCRFTHSHLAQLKQFWHLNCPTKPNKSQQVHSKASKLASNILIQPQSSKFRLRLLPAPFHPTQDILGPILRNKAHQVSLSHQVTTTYNLLNGAQSSTNPTGFDVALNLPIRFYSIEY